MRVKVANYIQRVSGSTHKREKQSVHCNYSEETFFLLFLIDSRDRKPTFPKREREPKSIRGEEEEAS